MTASLIILRRFLAALMITLGVPLMANATPVGITTLDFGPVAINTQDGLPVTFTFDAGYSFATASLSGSNFSFADPVACVTTTTCQIDFLPTAVGPRQAQLGVTECNKANACISASVTLLGTGFSVLHLPPLDFGMVALNTQNVLPVTFTFDAGYSFATASLSGPNFNFADPVACVTTTTCPIGFLPTAVGPSQAQLVVTECDKANDCISADAPLSGIGTFAQAVPEPGAFILLWPTILIGSVARRRSRRPCRGRSAFGLA